MKHTIDLDVITDLTAKLDVHPLYARVQTIEDLQQFMHHHVYSVWDFMSLLKFLQMHLAPTAVPWTPRGSASTRHFINQIVAGEESDEAPANTEGTHSYTSHFELYCNAMREVGADPSSIIHFSRVCATQGIEAGLTLDTVPAASARFVRSTFGFIGTGKAHVAAAAFAFGREQIIPTMFRALLDRMKIGERDAPTFHYYLSRHISLDGDSHGPMALAMIGELTDGDATKVREAEDAAKQAISARLEFWDGVQAALLRNARGQK